MSSDTQMTTYRGDGFAGYETQSEGGDQQQQQTGNVIQGAVVKFTNEANWVTRDGLELSPDLELVATDVAPLCRNGKTRCRSRLGSSDPVRNFQTLTNLMPTLRAVNGARARTGSREARGKPNTFFICSIRRLWISFRFRRPPPVVPSPSASWSGRSNGCESLKARTSSRLSA